MMTSTIGLLLAIFLVSSSGIFLLICSVSSSSHEVAAVQSSLLRAKSVAPFLEEQEESTKKKQADDHDDYDAFVRGSPDLLDGDDSGQEQQRQQIRRLAGWDGTPWVGWNSPTGFLYCSDYGKSTHRYHLKDSNNWEGDCKNTGLALHGIVYAGATECEKVYNLAGIPVAMYGLFKDVQETNRCKEPYWKNWKDLGCSGSTRTFQALLTDMDKQTWSPNDWKALCAKFYGLPPGAWSAALPTKCTQGILGDVYGQWSIPNDLECAHQVLAPSDRNAPDIEAEYSEYLDEFWHIHPYFCPLGTYVTSLDLRSGAAVDYFSHLKCSDGTKVDIKVGKANGGWPHYEQEAEGFCGLDVSQSTYSKVDVAGGLTLTRCSDSSQTTKYGWSYQNTAEAWDHYKCLPGQKIVGLQTQKSIGSPYVSRLVMPVCDQINANWVQNRAFSKVVSSNGIYTLRCVGDGSMIVETEKKSIWISGGSTSGETGATCWMQEDGNLVTYSSGRKPKPLWATGMSGHPFAWLKLDDSGDVFVIDNMSGSIFWKSGFATRRLDGDDRIPMNHNMSSPESDKAVVVNQNYSSRNQDMDEILGERDLVYGSHNAGNCAGCREPAQRYQPDINLNMVLRNDGFAFGDLYIDVWEHHILPRHYYGVQQVAGTTDDLFDTTLPDFVTPDSTLQWIAKTGLNLVTLPWFRQQAAEARQIAIGDARRRNRVTAEVEGPGNIAYLFVIDVGADDGPNKKNLVVTCYPRRRLT